MSVHVERNRARTELLYWYYHVPNAESERHFQGNTKRHRSAVWIISGCICIQYSRGLATFYDDAGVVLIVFVVFALFLCAPWIQKPAQTLFLACPSTNSATFLTFPQPKRESEVDGRVSESPSKDKYLIIPLKSPQMSDIEAHVRHRSTEIQYEDWLALQPSLRPCSCVTRCV